MLLLEAADDGVAPADLQPGLAVVVEREHACDLAANRLRLAGALDLAVNDPVAVLPNDDARVRAKAVDGERQPQHVLAGRSVALTEAEARRGRQREGPAGSDREARHPGYPAWRSRNESTRRHASSEASANSSYRRSKKECGAPS